METQYEAQLQALQNERAVIDAEFDKRINQLHEQEANLRRHREQAWEGRRVELAAVDAKINALYIAVTGAPIKAGDVVRAISKYGDLKHNERGFVESFSHDGDHNIDLVSLTVEGGSITVPRDVIVPELDADEVDKFRLLYALRYLKVAHGDYLHDIVRTAHAHLIVWTARIAQQPAAVQPPPFPAAPGAEDAP